MKTDPFALCPSWKKRGEKIKTPKVYHPPSPPPVNKQAVLTWLKFIKTDLWWRTQMPISDNALAMSIGVTSSLLSRVISGKDPENFPPGPTLDKISFLIHDIESRRLCFPFLSDAALRFRRPAPKYLWIDAPENPPAIPRLCKESNWSLWAVCYLCRYNNFFPIMMNGEPHVACAHCLPPNQYPAIGATAVKKSLIHIELEKFY